METKRLKHFCAVAELENLSRASELLGITHGGLHKSLRVLEDELGVSLTQAKGRGITLTQEGLEFYPKALEILKLVEEAMLRSQPPVELLVKLGGLEVFVPRMAELIHQDSLLKESSFELHEFSPGFLEQAILSETVDYGLTYIPVPTKGINFLEIKSFKMNTYCCNKDFLKKKPEEIPFVVPHSPAVMNPADIKNRDGWSESTFSRFEKFKTNSLSIALQFVRSGQACIFVPDFVATQSLEIPIPLKHLSGASDKKRSIYLVVREGQVEGKITKKISKLIRKYF